MSMHKMGKWIRQHALTIIILLSVLLRIAAAVYMGNDVVELPGTADQISYHQLALRVSSGKGFSFEQDWWPMTKANQPTAHWSFLYTLFLALLYKVIGPYPLAARLIQATIVGIVQPYLAFLLGKTIANRTVGLISAALTAVYAYFIYYAAAIMTEPFYIVVVMASLFLTMRISDAQRRNNEGQPTEKVHRYFAYVVLGIILGMGALLRQVFLLVVPFLFLFILWRRRREGIWGIVLASSIIVLMILPFTFYNSDRFDSFVLLNTNSGYAFFWANHPIYGTKFQPILSPQLGSYKDLIPQELRYLDEATLDRALLQRGIKFVVDDPFRYALLSISRIPAYFMFWPSSNSSMVSNLSRVGSFGLLLPFMIYGLIISWNAFVKRRFYTKPSILILYVFIAIYTMIHLLTWALIRYRLPVDAILVLFAAYGGLDLFERVMRRRKNR